MHSSKLLISVIGASPGLNIMKHAVAPRTTIIIKKISIFCSYIYSTPSFHSGQAKNRLFGDYQLRFGRRAPK